MFMRYTVTFSCCTFFVSGTKKQQTQLQTDPKVILPNQSGSHLDDVDARRGKARSDSIPGWGTGGTGHFKITLPNWSSVAKSGMIKEDETSHNSCGKTSASGSASASWGGPTNAFPAN